MITIDEYWDTFLKETGRNIEEKCSGDLSFEAKGSLSAQLESLVLTGAKTAFFSYLPTFIIDNQPLPINGELYVLLNHSEEPLCIIEITNVEIIPFSEVTWDMAKLEGEDENLSSWREKHLDYIEQEADILGFEPSSDIKVVFQTFKVIYK